MTSWDMIDTRAVEHHYIGPLQVLQFDTCSNRQAFEADLSQSLEMHGITCNIQEAKSKAILEAAFTQKKRNDRLEKFFKSVFSEVSFLGPFSSTAFLKALSLNL